MMISKVLKVSVEVVVVVVEIFVVVEQGVQKNCVCVQEFSKFCDLILASTGLLLVVHKMASH